MSSNYAGFFFFLALLVCHLQRSFKSFLIWVPFISYSPPIDLTRAASTTVNRSGEFIAGGRALSMMKTAALLSVAFIVLRFFASIPTALTVFTLKIHRTLSDGFDVSTEMICQCVPLLSFSTCRAILAHKDKFHSRLVMVCDLFYVLLNSVYRYLVENVCTYNHPVY